MAQSSFCAHLPKVVRDPELEMLSDSFRRINIRLSMRKLFGEFDDLSRRKILEIFGIH